MEILEAIKNTARKATNRIIDTSEEAVGAPKSSKELAKKYVRRIF